MIGVLTASERKREAFWQRMRDEGVEIEYEGSLLPKYVYLAVFKGYEPGGLIGYGVTEEDAYLCLMEQAEDYATQYAQEQKP